MQLTSKIRFQLKLQKFVFLALFFTTIGLLAWLSNHYSTRFDLTSNQRHSLSQRSIDLLNTMHGKIIFNAYVTGNTTRQAVDEIIQRYQKIKTDLELHFYNPDINFEQAKADKISLRNNIDFVIHYKNRQENIHNLSEDTISNAFFRLSKKDHQLVIFLSGHNERNPFGHGNRSYSKLRNALDNRGFNIDTINLILHPISKKTTLLVIAAPEKSLQPGEVKQIQTYINNGGNLLWLVDIGKLQGLTPVAKTLGVSFPAGIIVDNNTNLRRTLNIQSPAIIPVIEYPNNPITRQLNYTLFPIARGIKIVRNKKSPWTYTSLIQSLPKSWLETGSLSNEIIFESAKGDIAGPITLGITLERTINKPGQHNAHQLSNASTRHFQRIFIIGDSDFLANGYIGAGDNLSLGLKLFNWLSNDDSLLHIAPKRSTDLKLNLTDSQRSILGFGFLLALPLILLITGFTLWYRRIKR